MKCNLRQLCMAAVLTLSVVGCGDSSTGPRQAQIGGEWRFLFQDMTGVLFGLVVVCEVGAADFVITQTGTSFSGIQVGQTTVACFVDGELASGGVIDSETIVGGQIDGAIVTFRLGSLEGLHQATVTGSSMIGTAQWTLSQEGITVQLSGDFTAAKIG